MACVRLIPLAVVGTVAAVLAAPAPAALPAELELFEWQCELLGRFQSGTVYRARLTPEVFDGFQSFPLDLRLVDQEGVAWPALVWSRPDRSSVEPVRMTEVSFSEAAGGEDFAAREFFVEADRSGEAPVHNRVMVHAGSREQARRVEVWGGPDRDRLALLGAGFLVEQKTPAPVRNRFIDYPDARWPLVVVRVFRDARQPDLALDWRTTELMRVDHDDHDHDIVPLKRMDTPADEAPADGVTSFFLDAGVRNRPALYMTFSSEPTGFAVPVRVFGRNTGTNKWRWVVDGGLHHLDGHEQNRIPMGRADYRYYKVEFHHQAEKAPKVRHFAAAVLPHHLLFEARSDRKPYLFFGASRYSLDMANPLRRVDPASIDTDRDAEFGKRRVNPMRVAGTLSDYHDTLMRLGLGIVVLLVALVGVRMLRRRYL